MPGEGELGLLRVLLLWFCVGSMRNSIRLIVVWAHACRPHGTRPCWSRPERPQFVESTPMPQRGPEYFCLFRQTLEKESIVRRTMRAFEASAVRGVCFDRAVSAQFREPAETAREDFAAQEGDVLRLYTITPTGSIPFLSFSTDIFEARRNARETSRLFTRTTTGTWFARATSGTLHEQECEVQTFLSFSTALRQTTRPARSSPASGGL